MSPRPSTAEAGSADRTVAEHVVAEHVVAEHAVPSAAEIVVRLRPVVFATPTATGVHVRGWSSSFTVSGGAGVWKVWQVLARHLAGGLTPQRLAQPAGRPEVDRVIRLLLDQLREHDMLVEVPAGWGDREEPDLPPADLARWLESVAADPAAAWQRLRSTTVTVAGTGPVATSAARTLTGAGLAVDPVGAATTQDTVVRAGEAAVAARCLPEIGYVTPVSTPDRSLAHGAAVAARLSRAPGPAAAGAAGPGLSEAPGPALAGASVTPALAALIGAAAAHRIVCAVAGLPDPAEEAATLPGGEPAAPGPYYPSVLVARLDPVRATYHPWLPAARVPLPGAPSDIDAVGLRLEALSDPELGVLPPAVPGDLPQLPAMLALAGPALGVAATADAARVDATLRYAETVLGIGAPRGDGDARDADAEDGAGSAVRWAETAAIGVDVRHASGAALRRLVHAVRSRLDTDPVPEAEWAGEPAARRWWKALTLRFAVPARVVARRLPAGAVHAEIVTDAGPLAWAVEATAADAVAMAALAATGVAQARAAGVEVPAGPASLTGTAPTWRPADQHLAPWTDDSWYWPAGVIDNEERLQAALRAALTADGATLTGRPVVPVAADTGAADAHPDADSVGHALAVTGFVAQSFWWTAAATGTAVDVTGSTVAATAAASRGA
ncbi:hypothetical protein O7543_11510 [Solwaraspora sp. WMMA2080]|uniref:hypothetical protein n=1 Tax=unclassified Solwaraspora TaxID=2627926 RepID=UPI00248CBE40|nr:MULTISPECIES: hypothetical protein [unclassified Solwaraspora]WBB98447.1 hypothetical protein O7553_05855 [Solwaraspora sp. WMMA2059]WBC23000.1 hypothetical protein O7543_11510 [Solwaraspora sp. WMMA2080]